MKKILKGLKWTIIILSIFILTLFIASELYINRINQSFLDTDLYDVSTLEVNDVTLSYREYFSDQENVIIVVHGFLGNSYEYNDFFETMPEDFNYRVIAFDTVGFGLSDKPLDYTYTSDNQADTLIQAIDQLNIESYVLMAHSMGGEIAMRMTQKTDKIANLMLIDPVDPTILMEPVRIPRLLYTVLFKNYWLQRLGFNSAPYEPLPQEVFQASLIQNDMIPSAVLQKFSLDTDTSSVESLVDSIEMPSLLVYGKEDIWAPPALIEVYETILSDVESHIVEDTGHLIYLENPEILRSLIINFLNSLFE